jgi:seryl-tRNA synthetase
MKCRFKNAETGKTQVCHTLNGSSLALPRIVAALLENGQSDEGIKLPEILVPYFGKSHIQ